MSKALQEPLQGRDTALQAERTYKQLARHPDDRAILVSNRTTVFDRPRADLQPVDPSVEISDPIWDHKGFTRWTPDLVHCRLLVIGGVIVRMPPVLRRGYVSQLGNIAVTDVVASRHQAPTAAEITLTDWTLSEITARAKRRRVLLAAALGFSIEEIADALKGSGLERGKSTVHRWYIAERRHLAAHWQTRRAEPQGRVDAFTIDRWYTVFDKGQK